MNIRDFWQRPWPPYIVLILSLLLTVFFTLFISKQTEEQNHLRFDRTTQRITDSIESRLSTYVTLLRSGSGLFAASERITDEEFKAYVDRLNLQERYPGIQGIGFSAKVSSEDKAAFIGRIRTERGDNFAIRPDNPRNEYHSIIYLEPLDRRNKAAIGYDMFSEPVRRAAMERARDNGTPVTSGKVTLVQEIDEKKQSGFLIYVPVYAGGAVPETIEERREKLLGFVYSPFRADDLLQGILSTEAHSTVDFRVYDGVEIKSRNLLHDSQIEEKANTSYDPEYEKTATIEIEGRPWTITFSNRPELLAGSGREFTSWIFLGGAIVSLLLFYLSRSQFNALALVRNSSIKLQQANANVTFLSEASKILASSLDYQKTFQNVAEIAVPTIADWCVIDVLDGKGGLKQTAITHKNPEEVKRAKELRRLYPPDINAPESVGKVLRTGKSELYPFITDQLLQKVAQDDKQLSLLRSVGFTSGMIVPLSIGRKIIGTISFITAEGKRKYTKTDLVMAEELASRASLALENARLYKGMQEAVELRDNFISVASHELKTPVTSLKTYTQVLKKRLKDNAKDTKIYQKMDVQINKLTLLIQDLLNVSRFQSGTIQYRDEEFNLTTLVHEIVENIQLTAPDHTIKIEGSIKKKIFADRDRIGQVITNLLTNAVKYSPEQEKIIVRLSAKKDHVAVAVQDLGIGIDKKHLDKLFERFYRATGPEETTFPGMGLGLYISNEIVKRYGGQMIVESEKGKGSQFSFTLPYKERMS
jgi:signal transduction histidine kinase/CHASE1-domain containing sensor protein